MGILLNVFICGIKCFETKCFKISVAKFSIQVSQIRHRDMAIIGINYRIIMSSFDLIGGS